MLYVGLTEEHKKSANMFAELVGAQVISQSKALSSTEQETTNKTGNIIELIHAVTYRIEQSYLPATPT